jgi:hypothetical protein
LPGLSKNFYPARQGGFVFGRSTFGIRCFNGAAGGCGQE